MKKEGKLRRISVGGAVRCSRGWLEGASLRRRGRKAGKLARHSATRAENIPDGGQSQRRGRGVGARPPCLRSGREAGSWELSVGSTVGAEVRGVMGGEGGSRKRVASARF